MLFYSNVLFCLIENKDLKETLTLYYYLEPNIQDLPVNDNQSNLNENFVKTEEKLLDTVKYSEEHKSKFIKHVIENFSLFFNLVENIKNEEKDKKIETLHNLNKISKFSETYLLFLDVTIQLIWIKELELIEFINEKVLWSFLVNMIEYPNNSFLMNKTLKIFEMLLSNHFYSSLKPLLIDTFIKFTQSIFKIQSLEDIINLDNKCLKYTNLSSINSVYLMKLVQLFYFYFKDDHNVSSQITEYENFIINYIDIISKELTKDQQSVDEIKNAGDEEIKNEKNCNFFFKIVYDSEAFLFTTKKIIENSRKLNQKLKQLDT
jgi:hypothetical protein